MASQIYHAMTVPVTQPPTSGKQLISLDSINQNPELLSNIHFLLDDDSIPGLSLLPTPPKSQQVWEIQKWSCGCQNFRTCGHLALINEMGKPYGSRLFWHHGTRFAGAQLGLRISSCVALSPGSHVYPNVGTRCRAPWESSGIQCPFGQDCKYGQHVRSHMGKILKSTWQPCLQHVDWIHLPLPLNHWNSVVNGLLMQGLCKNR